MMLMYVCILAPFLEDVPLVEFMYLVFAHTPGESYCRQLRSWLLCLYDVFHFEALINSLIFLFCAGAGPLSVL